MKTYQFGLIGYPLGHSRSPMIHTAALEAAGLAGQYTLYPIVPLPDGAEALRNLTEQVRSGEIDGLNVTIPHKQSVIPLLDELDTNAQGIGAVNTICKHDIYLTGANTDASGFMTDLLILAPDLSSENLEQRNALVLGAGGSARAVVWALLHHGWQVMIAARRMEQAREIASQLSAISDQLTDISNQQATISNDKSKIPNLISCIQLDRPSLAPLIAHHQSSPTLIVNCTPLGMYPQVDTSSWPEGVHFPSGAVVYDLIYNPLETQFIRQAHQAGLRAFNGLGMLVEQAAQAFELWTGLPAPRADMRQAALQV